MRSFALSFVLFVSMAFSAAAAQAQDRPTTLCFSTAMVMPISSKGEATAPSAAESVAIGIPVGEDITLIPELGMVTSFTTFQPSPQLQFGVSFRLADRFALGLSAAYRYMPHWANVPNDSHIAASSIAPIAVLVPSTLFLGFPIGVAYNSSAKAVSFPLGVKFIALLPL